MISMQDTLRETYRLWADQPEYKSRIKTACGLIRDTISHHKAYVAYSGGKDSLVMTHLALQEDPDILVWHWDYGPAYMPRAIEHEVRDIAMAIGVKNYKVDTTPLYQKLGRTAKGVLGRVLYGRVIPEMVNAGYSASFVGLRSEESLKRKQRTQSAYEKTAPGMTTVFPIRGLTVRDVWAYIASNDLPYCSHYDRYGALEGWESVRFCTYFDPEFAWMGRANVDGVIQPEFRNLSRSR